MIIARNGREGKNAHEVNPPEGRLEFARSICCRLLCFLLSFQHHFLSLLVTAVNTADNNLTCDLILQAKVNHIGLCL